MQQTDKMLLTDLAAIWLQMLATEKSAEDQITNCHLIASDAVAHVRSIRHNIESQNHKLLADAFRNEMGRVLVFIGQYSRMRFKEEKEAQQIVGKTQKALEQLRKDLM